MRIFLEFETFSSKPNFFMETTILDLDRFGN